MCCVSGYPQITDKARRTGVAEVKHAVVDVRLRLQQTDAEGQLRWDVDFLVAGD